MVEADARAASLSLRAVVQDSKGYSRISVILFYDSIPLGVVPVVYNSQKSGSGISLLEQQ